MANGSNGARTHTLSVLVSNKPGVLTHVSGLFSRRGYNIDSLTVGVTENPEISRMTIVAHGDEHVIEQVTKQLNKLIDVIKVIDVTPMEAVDRELALIKVAAKAQSRSEVIQIVDIFRAKIIDVSSRSMIIEVTGDEQKVDALVLLLRQFGIKELARTGKVSMVRGARVIKA